MTTGSAGRKILGGILPRVQKSRVGGLPNFSDVLAEAGETAILMANQGVTQQDIPVGLRRTVHVTSEWLKRIADEMGHGDKQAAYHALRGVLFAIRDRLPVEEVMDFSAQLPVLIRGVFFEGYKTTGKPETYRSQDEFLSRVNKELQAVNGGTPEAATRAVFALLEKKVTEGEIEDVRQLLPSAVRSLWPEE